MNKPVFTYVLLTGVVIALLAVLVGTPNYRIPDSQRGYQPEQPIAFSHHLHAGELAIDCQYCHTGAESSRHAGIPSANVCMNCHANVTTAWGEVLAADKRLEELKEQAAEEGRELTAEESTAQPPVSPELKKLYRALALNEQLQPIPNATPEPIAWVKVHNLPDYVYFDHRAHVRVGIDCQTCHGNVETMERVRQVETLWMGWCVDCHRTSNQIGVKGQPVQASVDCTTCHY